MMYGRTQYNPESQFIREIPEELRVTYGDSPKRQPVARVSTNNVDPNSYATKFGGVQPKAAPTAAAILSAGDTVAHPMFGRGMILSAKKMGADTLYEVAFDTVGTKKLMATFAKLTKI